MIVEMTQLKTKLGSSVQFTAMPPTPLQKGYFYTIYFFDDLSNIWSFCKGLHVNVFMLVMEHLQYQKLDTLR